MKEIGTNNSQASRQHFPKITIRIATTTLRSDDIDTK
jgi:hypothetical protein